MKLKFFHKPQDLKEADIYHKLDLSDIDIPRPLGIEAEKWTPELKEHFKEIKLHRPKLYEKIMNGN